MHWIAGIPPDAATLERLSGKTRYRMADARCRIESTTQDVWRAEFELAQWAPTPGQYLVLYDGDVCLGGAVIAESGETNLVSNVDNVTEV